MARATRGASFSPNSSSFRFVFTSLSMVGMILAALTASAAAWAQVSYTGTAATQNFGSQAVGSSSAATTLTFSIAAGTTVGSIAVVTTGIENLDFTNAGGGTCAAETYSVPATCTVDVTFKPRFAGLRMGAVVFFSEAKNTGAVLGQVLIYGTGTGPQIGYSPSPAASFTLGCCSGLFLSNVRGMTVDAAGNQFIASTDGNYVVELPADGGTGAASAISPVANGKGLSQPSGVAIDGAGDLLIADSSNNRVVVLPPGGGAATAMDPTVDGKGLSYPMGMSVNGAGDLFIADDGNSRVVEVPAAGGAPTAISPVVNGKAPSEVQDVALDAAGDLFILDVSNNRVIELPAGSGTPLAIAPTVNGIGLHNPYGVVVDVAGNLFITDNANQRVVEVPAGGGPAFAINLDGTTLYNPVGMAVDGPGNFYIVDNSHVRVLELQRSLPPTLNFPTVTGVDTIDTTDGTQKVQIQNLGNEALTLTDLKYPADFAEASGDTNACTGSTSVNPGVVCDLPIEFAPTESGPLSEQIVLTDNALNVTGTQQAIAVSGTGYADVEGATHISVTSTSPASVFVGTPFSITVTALTAGGTTATTYNGTVNFTSSDPDFVNPGPLTLASGTGQLTVTLETVGTETISATDTTAAWVTGSGSFNVAPALILPSSGTPPSVSFGAQSVGSASAAQTLSFSVPAGTTVSSIAVLTQGAPNLDFANVAGGTCAAQEYSTAATCTVNVAFTPKYAGPRYGAVSFYDNAYVLATVYLYGSGVGPQVTFANSTSGNYLPSSQTPVGSGFGAPMGIAVDASGNLFVADCGNGAVMEIIAVNGYIPASPTINTLSSGFNCPAGVAVDGAGNVFVADHGNGAVKEILAAGGYTTVNTLGSGFNAPAGVAVDRSGNVFVAEEYARDVREILATGGYTSVNTLGSGFCLPQGVAVDGSGNVFVADWCSAVKEMLAVNGSIPASPTINNLGSGFLDPVGVAVDASGDVFVTDPDSSALKEIVASGGYSTVKTLGGGIMGSVAVDASGNVYVSSNNLHLDRVGQVPMVQKLDYADSPSVVFPTTTEVDSIDMTDGPQTVTVSNAGNTVLSLSALTWPTDFPEAPGNTNACSSSTSVNPGLGCDLPIEFAPEISDPLSEQIMLTDNALNVAGAQQSIAVSGTGALPSPPAITTPAPGSTLTGPTITFTWNPGLGSTAFMLKAGTRGAGSSDIYNGAGTTATSVAVSNIPTNGRTLYVQLSYEMGTTWTSINYTFAEFGPPPLGALAPAVDSVTGNTTVGQSDSVIVAGWVADEGDGAPLTNVKVYIDGNATGTPTLGMPRYDVAVRFNNPAYLDSGFQLLYPASSLSVGTHAVTVVAIDSGGRSTTFGPVSFSVSATAGASPPFGSLGPVEDTVTFGNTVGQSDSLDVKGWVADPADGSPLSNVSIYIDGTLAGTPTLGLASPDVAAQYNNAAYAHARFDFLSAASSLPPGPHKLTVVAVDSGGRTTTLGPRTFAVAATAGAGPPFGGLAPVVDSTTQSTTVSPSDSLEVNGWVADVTDGSPLSNVKVYIDEVLAGTPTLGLVSPNVAAEYHNAAYGHARYQFLSPASGLSAGTHWVTVVAIDSGGRSTTFGPRIFTVQ